MKTQQRNLLSCNLLSSLPVTDTPPVGLHEDQDGDAQAQPTGHDEWGIPKRRRPRKPGEKGRAKVGETRRDVRAANKRTSWWASFRPQANRRELTVL
jgi:hypothetical protein